MLITIKFFLARADCVIAIVTVGELMLLQQIRLSTVRAPAFFWPFFFFMFPANKRKTSCDPM